MEAAEPKTKLEEQATGKAELSYSYWAAKAAGDAPPPQPKKLSSEEAAAHAQQLQHTASGASAWNAAGTWEERPLKIDWVQGQLGELLGAVRHSHQGAEVEVMDTSCSGEAHQWLVRGKKRAGFELVVEFKWRARLGGADAGATVTGTAKVPHAAADELDELQLEVKADASSAGGPPAAAADAPAGSEGGDSGSKQGEGERAAAAAATPPSEEQRQRAHAAVSSMLPAVETALEALLERIRQR